MTLSLWRGKVGRSVPPSPEANRTSRIIAEVAAEHGLTVGELVGPGRHRVYAWPRQKAMWRLYHETRLSLPAVARKLGRKDHTTVLYGIRAYVARIGAEKLPEAA